MNPNNARTNHIDWHQMFMAVAKVVALRSKDPSTQVGAVVVNADNHIVGTGYNGFPRGCSDLVYPWGRLGQVNKTKYPYVVHAELNAILNCGGHSLKGCSIYTVLFPCNECAKAIIQAGITTVYYANDKYAATDSVEASKAMLKSAGVKTIIPKMSKILIELDFTPSGDQGIKTGETCITSDNNMKSDGNRDMGEKCMAIAMGNAIIQSRGVTCKKCAKTIAKSDDRSSASIHDTSRFQKRADAAAKAEADLVKKTVANVTGKPANPKRAVGKTKSAPNGVLKPVVIGKRRAQHTQASGA